MIEGIVFQNPKLRSFDLSGFSITRSRRCDGEPRSDGVLFTILTV